MAITVTNNNTRGDSYDGAYGGTSIGGGAGGGLAVDSYYQGTNAWGRKIGSANSEIGFSTTITSINMTTAANSVMLAKGLILNNPALNVQGIRIRLGSTTNYYAMIIGDNGSRGDVSYPAKGGWVIRAIDPNVTAWRDETGGTGATLSAVTAVGVTGNVSTVSKDLNLFLDASDFSQGLFLVGNTPDGDWDDFILHDQGTTTNRFGNIQTVEGIIYVFGGMVVGRNNAGTTSATTFTDSNRTIVFPGGSVAAGWNFLEYDLTNSSTVVNLSSMTHVGRGRDNLQHHFDSELSVNGTTDAITILNHGLLNGEAVLYSVNGGTTISGLTDATEYFVGEVTTDTFTLFTSRQLAFDAGTSINLTAAGAGTGQRHTLTRQPVTKPDLTITGTGGSFSATGCSFNKFRNITGKSVATFDSCNFIGIANFDLQGAVLTGCTIDTPTRTYGSAAVTASADESENISSTEFIANTDERFAGHAINIDSAPTGSLDFSGITFTNYGPDAQPFNALGISANVITNLTSHPFVTGDPVYYSSYNPSDGSAGTALSGLTTNTLYFVRKTGTDSVTLHKTKEAAVANSNIISITAGSNQTHVLYSAYAAIVNSTSANVVINVLDGGSSPSYRNTLGGTVTVNNAVSIVVENMAEGSSAIIDATETAGTIVAGDRILEGLADSTGKVSTSINYEGGFGAGLDVVCRVRNQGFPTAAIYDDGGVFTNQTTASNSTTIGDMTLLPTVPAVNDAYYFGHNEQFRQLRLDLSQNGVGTWTITWEYWNGSTWTALSGVSDGTSGFTTDGVVSWTVPGDWADTTINSQGPYRYVRARVSAYTSITTRPLGRFCKLDVTRYLPFSQNRIITSTGLTVNVNQVEDTISTF